MANTLGLGEQQPHAATEAQRGGEPQGSAPQQRGGALAHDHDHDHGLEEVGLRGEVKGRARGGGGDLPPFGYDAHGRSGAWPWPPGPGDLTAWAQWCAEGGPQPAILRSPHGISGRLAINADAAQSRPGEELRALWNATDSQALQRHAREHEHFSSPEILRQCLFCVVESQGRAGDVSFWSVGQGEEVFERVLRALWLAGLFIDPSQRQELAQQRSREFGDAVYAVSHFAPPFRGGHQPSSSGAVALSCLRKAICAQRSLRGTPDTTEEIWGSASDEEKVWWLVDACLRANRIGWEARLKAYGNAVVPVCAEVAGWVIRELDGF